MTSMNDKDDQTVILDALAEIAENLLPDCLVETVQVVKCLVLKFNLPDQAS